MLVTQLVTGCRLNWFNRSRPARQLHNPTSQIVCKVGRMLICCTGAGTHNFQIAAERLQYRMKQHVL